jgi:Iron hydrogenase small subunit
VRRRSTRPRPSERACARPDEPDTAPPAGALLRPFAVAAVQRCVCGAAAAAVSQVACIVQQPAHAVVHCMPSTQCWHLVSALVPCKCVQSALHCTFTRAQCRARSGALGSTGSAVPRARAGCIGGAGNPRADKARIQERQQALYSIDERMTVRQSDENPAVRYLYASFLGEPSSDVAHRLLHTHYVPGGAPVIVKPVSESDGAG